MKIIKEIKYCTQPATGTACSVSELQYMNQNQDHSPFSRVLLYIKIIATIIRIKNNEFLGRMFFLLIELNVNN